jgi:4-amino-4-deoxy-L-arabinose transferase-like glycosyltransferase
MFSSSRVSRGLFFLVLLLAFVLRFYKIDAQSLWYDEGNSARIAERSIQLIIEGSAGDIHPPLYYVLLKFWRAIFGDGETALRAFSTLCGVLTVLFAYLIGRDLFNTQVGLLASFFVAVSPFAVYYSQEVRMYALLALCASVSTWALIRFSLFDIRNSNRSLHVVLVSLFVVATAAGLWTQYAYPFVMLAQGVYVLGWLAYQKEARARLLITYTIANVVAIALFLPWLQIAIRQISGWGIESQKYDLGAAMLDSFRWLVVGRTATLANSWIALVSTGLILVSAIFARHDRLKYVLLALLAFLPLGLVFAFGLYREAYLKILLVCVSPMWIFFAARIGEMFFYSESPPLKKAFGALILVATCVPVFFSLNNLYHNVAYARDDYRGIYRLISANTQPDDAVLFIAPNQWEVFTYYKRDDKNLFPMKYRPVFEGEVAQQLEKIVFGRARIFVLYFAEREADPNGWYERWLALNVAKVHEEWIGNVRLAVYSARSEGLGVRTEELGDESRNSEASLKSAIVDQSLIAHYQLLPIELVWRAEKKIDKRYKVFVHIGKDDAPPIAQFDGEPVGGFRPTDSWNAGEEILDRRGVWFKPGTPRGKFGVFVGLYDGATGERFGQRIKIGEVDLR